MGRRPGAHGLVTSSPAVLGGRHPLPVPASAKLRRARGSPTRSCGSDHRPSASHSRRDTCSRYGLPGNARWLTIDKTGKLLIFLFLLSGEGLRKGEGENGKTGTITSAEENKFPASKFAQYQDQRTRREKSAIC